MQLDKVTIRWNSYSPYGDLVQLQLEKYKHKSTKFCVIIIKASIYLGHTPWLFVSTPSTALRWWQYGHLIQLSHCTTPSGGARPVRI